MARETVDRPDTTGWLSSKEAASKLGGISLATLTRMAQHGEIERERGADGKYVYDPESFPSEGEGPTARVPLMPDAQQVMLHGGADMLRASGGLVVQLVQKVIESQTATIAALETNARVYQQLFERMADRATVLETAHTDMVKAREGWLDRTAEREALAEELKRGGELKAKAIGQLVDQAPVLLELAAALMRPAKEATCDEPETVVEVHGEPSEPSEPSGP